MNTAPPVLQIFDVDKTYRRGPEVVHALTAATMAVSPGELIALVGPSGSGKTTLLNLLCGWEEPDAGRFVWRGDHVPRTAELTWHEIAIVPQALGLIEELTIAENVELPDRLRRDVAGLPTDEAALIEELGLASLVDRVPSEVSLGEQQRAAIARALVVSPSLLLADEPTGHQDAVWALRVMRTLRRACREGTSCVVATHNAEVLRYVDRVVQIEDGRLRKVAKQPIEAEPT
ncbi:MAG TPA: ATP-binding cassette domain-containing protein [Actinomycetota bacterium]|nr:ATP-binding cassette domain-containing protein [Actinomycetota bacterium]